MQFERFEFQAITQNVLSDLSTRRVSAFVPQRRMSKTEESAAIEVVPPPPTFSEAELIAAREEGYRSGFIEGEKKGTALAESEIAVINRQTLALMQPLSEQMLDLFAHYNHMLCQWKQQLPTLALALAKKAAGEALAHAPMVNVSEVTIQCIERMLGEAELHVYVHPTLSDALETKLAAHFASSHESGDVLIHKDGSLAPSACRIEWKHGGLVHDPATLWQHLEQLTAGIAAAEVHMHEDVSEANIKTILAEYTSELPEGTQPLLPEGTEDDTQAPQDTLDPKPPEGE